MSREVNSAGGGWCCVGILGQHLQQHPRHLVTDVSEHDVCFFLPLNFDYCALPAVPCRAMLCCKLLTLTTPPPPNHTLHSTATHTTRPWR